MLNINPKLEKQSFFDKCSFSTKQILEEGVKYFTSEDSNYTKDFLLKNANPNNHICRKILNFV